MKNILCIAILCLLMGCNQSIYESVAPTPTLEVVLDRSMCAPGESVKSRVIVSQQGVHSGYYLSTIIVTGDASIKLDDQSISTIGDWVEMQSKSIELLIIPSTQGDLTISFQVKAAEGSTSNIVKRTVVVKELDPLTLTAAHEAKIINPAPQDKFPMTISTNKVGIDGKIKIIPSVAHGKGYFLHQNKVVTDAEIVINNNEIIHYQPAGLGEQILSIEANVGGQLATISTYVDVVNVISVSGTFVDCFSIAGADSEYNIEGEEITLELINKEKFNFEVAGWYDQSTGQLLSSEPIYKLKLTCGSPSNISLKLKPRVVTIKRGNSVNVETQYLVQENGRPVVRYVYDRRMQLEADSRSADNIFFYYESYCYQFNSVIPQKTKFMASPSISVATSMTGYFWRIDGEFKIYLRQADNPTLTFIQGSHSVKSASTTYNIPANIIFQ